MNLRPSLRAVLVSADREAAVTRIETQNVNVHACRFRERHGCRLGAVKDNACATEPEVAHELQLLWSLDLSGIGAP